VVEVEEISTAQASPTAPPMGAQVRSWKMCSTQKIGRRSPQMGNGSGSQVAGLLRRGRGDLLQSWGTAQASRGRADRLRLTNYPTAELTSIRPRKRDTERTKHPPHRTSPPTKRERTGGAQESHHEGAEATTPTPWA